MSEQMTVHVRLYDYTVENVFRL